MKTLWDFIIKHEFWFSFLVIIGLHFGEYKTGDGWMGGLFMEDDDFDIYLRELDARNRKSDCRVILSRE